jgi:hypothetical protein
MSKRTIGVEGSNSKRRNTSHDDPGLGTLSNFEQAMKLLDNLKHNPKGLDMRRVPEYRWDLRFQQRADAETWSIIIAEQLMYLLFRMNRKHATAVIEKLTNLSTASEFMRVSERPTETRQPLSALLEWYVRGYREPIPKVVFDWNAMYQKN